MKKLEAFEGIDDDIAAKLNYKKYFLDVWLIDFLSEKWGSLNIHDTTSLYLLQLACIVHMVPRWKKMKLRVFMFPSIQLAGKVCVRQ